MTPVEQLMDDGRGLDQPALFIEILVADTGEIIDFVSWKAALR